MCMMVFIMNWSADFRLHDKSLKWNKGISQFSSSDFCDSSCVSSCLFLFCIQIVRLLPAILGFKYLVVAIHFNLRSMLSNMATILVYRIHIQPPLFFLSIKFPYSKLTVEVILVQCMSKKYLFCTSLTKYEFTYDWLLLNIQQVIFQLYSRGEQVQWYIKMRERMGQPGQWLVTTIEMVWRVG